ncbi:hypothetical protein M422DRAFT_247613 [Sphaerobolus stellatus SS14]|nr:hypothetical protein M422DRAFT_247613 [Sphaerobolus stellatus SS14]
MKIIKRSTKETENVPNCRPYCAEDLKDLKATDLRNLVKDNPDGKWPEEQHEKFYDCCIADGILSEFRKIRSKFSWQSWKDSSI